MCMCINEVIASNYSYILHPYQMAFVEWHWVIYSALSCILSLVYVDSIRTHAHIHIFGWLNSGHITLAKASFCHSAFSSTHLTFVWIVIVFHSFAIPLPPTHTPTRDTHNGRFHFNMKWIWQMGDTKIFGFSLLFPFSMLRKVHFNFICIYGHISNEWYIKPPTNFGRNKKKSAMITLMLICIYLKYMCAEKRIMCTYSILGHRVVAVLDLLCLLNNNN